jgi:UTP-glucose-1-phosphate uridylyltransferase
MKPTLVVMAAGVGSRYGGLKQIDPVGPAGEIMLDYSVFDAIRAGFGKVVFIIRHDLEQDFKTVIGAHFTGKVAVEYVFQELANLPAGFSVPPDRKKPWGTGHAVLQCRPVVKEPFAVINADDFYGRRSYAVIADYLRQLPADSSNHAMVGFQLVNTLSDHGSVTRGICETDAQRRLQSVVERFKIERTPGGARYEDEHGQWITCRGDEIASMNLFGFTPALFALLAEKFPVFLKSALANPKSEFLLPAIVNNLIQEKRITMTVLQTPEPWFGVTYKEDKPIVCAGIRKQIAAGAYPERLWN